MPNENNTLSVPAKPRIEPKTTQQDIYDGIIYNIGRVKNLDIDPEQKARIIKYLTESARLMGEILN